MADQDHEDRVLKIAQEIVNGITITAPCTCGEEDRCAPDCAYEIAIDSAWDHALVQAEEIAQDVDLQDIAA